MTFHFSIKEIADLVQTGDIVLMNGCSGSSLFVKLFTVSDFSHIAFIYRHPNFNNGRPAIFESIHSDDDTDPNVDLVDGKVRAGVRLVDFEDYLDKFYGRSVAIRTLTYPRIEIAKQMNEYLTNLATNFIQKHRGKPYESRWYEFFFARFNIFDLSKSVTEDSFFCSELVASFYLEAGLLHRDHVAANQMVPDDFHSSNHLKLCYPVDRIESFIVGQVENPDTIITLSQEYFVRLKES